MIYRDVQTLKVAFSWATDFILANGIMKIPEWWAFIIETCGFLSWVVMFIFAISLFVGYSRQMSSFYFLYEAMTGRKLGNPYKPAFLFFLLWCSLYLITGTATLSGVYFIKYGYLYAGLALLGGLMGLAVLCYVALKVIEEPKAAKQPPFNPKYQQQQQPPQFYPAHPAMAHQNHGAIPNQYSAGQPQQHYIGSHAASQQPASLQIGGGTGVQPSAPAPDYVFEEAISLLGLERGFTKAQLKKRYHDLAKKFHADKGGTNGLHLKIKACYEYLIPFAQ